MSIIASASGNQIRPTERGGFLAISKDAQELAQQINSAANQYASEIQRIIQNPQNMDNQRLQQILNALKQLGQDPANPVPKNI